MQRGSADSCNMVPGLCLLLLLLLPRISADTPEPCEFDDEDFRCFCNFTDPEPNWSSALQCTVAVDVEIRGGGRGLEQFLRHANTDPSQYVDMVKALRLRRLTLGDARAPIQLLVGLLRALGSSQRFKELTLENMEITGTLPPVTLEATGPALSTLRFHNVSWASGKTWLSDLQRLLKPGLKVLSITRTPTLSFACAQLDPFPALSSLDLSENSALDELGLQEALCTDKFPALQDLALRRAGVQTLDGVCSALAAAGVRPRSLDLSHNALRTPSPGAAAQCVWPGELNALILSFAGLEQVPRGLPAKLDVLDLRGNRLTRVPEQDELPEVKTMILDRNPFLDPEFAKHHETQRKSSAVPASATSVLAIGLAGAAVLLRGAGDFA
ncbi:monocyte differentiation antigen CD14 [Sorex fumeus]|uniref:monocyte differentiation antigen CD14 n=1 Tax=Sorex fumeus TaxID=62283 RepID=UPI0024AE511A|nr:monocyte differentiation antigen CD14 [Sorex fumeus]